MSPRRVLVIGLDGAAPSMLWGWAERGRLPFLREVMQEGHAGICRSTTPAYTPTAWTTITTGAGPGRHGIFGFTRRLADGAEVLVDASLVGARTVWDHLSEAGRPSIVVNVPVTYAPRSLDGVLVSGMGTPPSAPVFTFPSALGEEIRARFPTYVPDVAVDESIVADEGKEASLVERIERASLDRIALTEHLIDTRDWEFAMVVVEGPDRLQHLSWKAFGEPGSITERGERYLAVFERIDRALRGLVERAGRDGPLAVVLVSDHGFRGLEHLVFPNVHLEREGLLRVRRSPMALGRLAPPAFRRAAARWIRRAGDSAFAPRVAYDARRTEAVFGQVFEQGLYVLAEGAERGPVRERAMRALTSMPGPEGELAVASIAAREDLFEGPYVERAPDLFPTFAIPGVAASGSLARRTLWEDRRETRQGTHHPDGIVAAFGDGIAGTIAGRIDAADVGASILALLGCPLPADVDGAPLLAAGETPRSDDATVLVEERSDSPYTADEEEAVVEHLRGLGYL